MRKFSYTFLILTSVLFLSSCIQSEEPNSEADIISCEILESEILKTKPIIDNASTDMYSVVLLTKTKADLSKVTPHFELTPGAEIEPANDTPIDLNTPKKYIVTSEDKQWKKEYTVLAMTSSLPTKFSFEQKRVQKNGSNKYHVFYETIGGELAMTWASGNSGFSFSNSGMDPYSFPTQQDPKGYQNNCLKVVTLSTGTFGAIVSKPIAAGNLFIGTFDANGAMSKPLEATEFGLPFNKNPKKMIGYYKYKAGKNFKEVNKPKPNRKDKADVYAIFYETDENLTRLNGTNQFTHPNIISIARIEESQIEETNEWTRFEIPFILKEGKVVDEAKLDDEKYNLAIVFTSSKEGDHFHGAIGSTLYIDEVEIIY